ncbi:hypothetical protein NWO25_12190 [Enterococcus lactis]|nr:hypothetical protein [Enterococcus lactis]
MRMPNDRVRRKGNFDKKEEVSECRVRKQENGRRKKFVEKDVQK